MFRRQCHLPRWAFPESVYKGYFIITWKLMRVLVFLVLPSWEADRVFPLHLIWLLTTRKLFNLSQWVTLRPHQILLWKPRELHWGNPKGSSVQDRLFLSGEVKPAFGRWDLQRCCCLWVRAGKQRQVKGRAHKGMPGESHQRLPAAFPFLLLRRTRLAVVAVN